MRRNKKNKIKEIPIVNYNSLLNIIKEIPEAQNRLDKELNKTKYDLSENVHIQFNEDGYLELMDQFGEKIRLDKDEILNLRIYLNNIEFPYPTINLI